MQVNIPIDPTSKGIEATDDAQGIRVTRRDCLNCGTPLQDRFCHVCGEQRRTRADLRPSAYLVHGLNEVFDLDHNALLTLQHLITRPGKLTVEFMAGRTGQFADPFKVYLIASVLFFLFGWGTFLELSFGNSTYQTMFAQIARREQRPTEQVTDEFFRELQAELGYGRFVSVFVSGLILAALYVRSGVLYVEHLVFSLHVFSFEFLLGIVYTIVYRLLPGSIAAARAGPSAPIIDTLYYLIYALYALLAIKAVYGQSWGWTVLKTTLFCVLQVMLFFGIFIAVVIVSLIVILFQR